MMNKTGKKEENQKASIPSYISMESVVGAACLLAAKSTMHKHLFASDYEWLIFPAIRLKQFFLLRSKNNEPVAFVSWAMINDEVEKRLLSGVVKLKPSDWNSGNKMFIIDVISPFVPESEIMKQLNDGRLKGREVNVLVPKNNSKGFEIKSLQAVSKNIENKKTKPVSNIDNTKKPHKPN